MSFTVGGVVSIFDGTVKVITVAFWFVDWSVTVMVKAPAFVMVTMLPLRAAPSPLTAIVKPEVSLAATVSRQLCT